jgi:hypothetical protein
MHNVEVEIVDSVVLELLLANRFDTLLVVEGVPQLGNDEQLFSLDKAVLDGASEALAGFLFVAVVWENFVRR